MERLRFYDSFFHCEISKVRGPISAKFCHMVRSMFNLQMPVQIFFGDRGCPPPKKKIGGAKNANFGPISDCFSLLARIFPERIDISKIGKLFD